MEINYGFHSDGNCWKFCFRLDKFSGGKLYWFSFWRFFISFYMVGKKTRKPTPSDANKGDGK